MPSVSDPLSSDAVRLERRVLTLWRTRAFLGVVPTTAAFGVVTAVAASFAVGLATFVVMTVVVSGIVWWWTAVAWRAWRFRVGTRALHLEHGVIVHRTSTIPFHRVQHIDIEAGPLERRLHLASMVLRTASAASDSTVPGLDAADAERERQRILELVGTGDAT